MVGGELTAAGVAVGGRAYGIAPQFGPLGPSASSISHRVLARRPLSGDCLDKELDELAGLNLAETKQVGAGAVDGVLRVLRVWVEGIRD